MPARADGSGDRATASAGDARAGALLARLRQIDPLAAIATYYIAGGLWPLVSLRSFMFVTGHKREGWLVQSFGLFLAATGVAMLPTDAPSRPARERLAVLGALSLAVADSWFVARRRIRPIYLADALVELALAGSIVRRRQRQEET